MNWEELKKAVDDNAELKEMQDIGWKKGASKGKSMAVHYVTMMLALEKQMKDLQYLFDVYAMEEKIPLIIDIRQAIADVRNVAGCLFLKMQDLEVEERAKERR